MNTESLRENITFPKIASDLKEMVDIDQEMRERQLTEEDYWDVSIDSKNTARMKEIIAEIGWPMKSKVGEIGESNAWLLVQHADQDVTFQRHCLQLMKDAPATEVDQINIAYLEDRVRVNQGRGQLYGTQFKHVDGKYIPKAIEDEANIDVRRALIGMGPLQEQIDMMYRKYGSDQDSKES